MSAESVIRQGRVFTEGLMQTTCTIGRANGVFTEDPVTHVESEGFDLIYSGPCKLKFTNGTPSGGEVPGIVVADQSATVSLPIDAAGAGDVTTGDVWTCTSNPMDVSLVGKTLRIAGVHRQTFATAHRFPVQETT